MSKSKTKKAKAKCPKCGSESIIKFGSKMTKEGKKQRYQCQKCGHVFY